MTEPPFREEVLGCSRKATFKYFFARDRVATVWAALEAAYGPVRRNEALRTMEIEHRRFIFRTTMLGNPITVFRKRACADGDVAELHRLIGFSGP